MRGGNGVEVDWRNSFKEASLIEDAASMQKAVNAGGKCMVL